MNRRHNTLKNVLNKLYVIRKIARIKDDKRLEVLASSAIRELEDLSGEVLDMDTWLANNQGLYNLYGDVGFTADYKDDNNDEDDISD